MESMVDIAIIGAGPAGLSAAINGVARGKSVRVFNAGENYLARAERIDNYLGFYQVSGREMMEQFLSHAAKQGIRPEKGRVANLLPFGDRFMLNFGGDMIEAKTVILATGVSKAKPLPGEQELLGRGVSYCATCDGMLYRGKRAVVWGMSQEAAEEANFLHGLGVQVTYVSSKQRAQGLNEAIPYLAGAVAEVLGDQIVTGVRVGENVLDTDGVFILRDSIAPSTLVEGIAVQQGYVAVNREMETNIPGLYAAGDCTGKPLQISKAVGEGLIAAQQAAKYLDSLQ